MKTYTLEQLLSKLIKRKYIENQTKIKIEIENNTIKTTRASLYSDESNFLLAPVAEVYVSIGDTANRRRLLTIKDFGIDYNVTIASIEKDVRRMFGNKIKDVYSGYILIFVCLKLPDIFLNSFLYQEGLISPDIYLTLTRYKNTIMSSATYSECVSFINKHKNYVAKKYGFRSGHVGDEPLSADTLLGDAMSVVAGFRVKFRAGSDGGYVIEAAK